MVVWAKNIFRIGKSWSFFGNWREVRREEIISITGNRGKVDRAVYEAGGVDLTLRKSKMTSFKTGEKVTSQVLFSKHIEEKRKEDEKVERFLLLKSTVKQYIIQ